MDADVGMDVSQSNSTPLFVEIFAGKGAFSRAALQAGLRVVSIDHEVAQPLAPMVALDLTSKFWNPPEWGQCTWVYPAAPAAERVSCLFLRQ